MRLSGSINSREGLRNLTLNPSFKADAFIKLNKAAIGIDNISSTASYTFGRTAYTPQIDMAYTGFNLSGALEVGVKSGVNTNGVPFPISYSRQRLRDRGVITRSAFGYFNMQNRNSNNEDLYDFNRENEGAIRATTPNLAIPITTPDIYSVTGQGTGGMYRPYRGDIGILTNL